MKRSYPVVDMTFSLSLKIKKMPGKTSWSENPQMPFAMLQRGLERNEVFPGISYYLMNLSIALFSSSRAAVSSRFTASITHVERCSLRMTLLTELIADSMADSWISTSEQSLPSSTILFVDSICPMILDMRLRTFLVCSAE